MKLELVNRMNSALMNSTNSDKNSKENSVNELLVANLTKLAEKIEKIGTSSSDPPPTTSNVSTV